MADLKFGADTVGSDLTFGPNAVTEAVAVVHLLTQSYNLSLWTAGSGGVVRGDDKTGST